jgi:hypothetical protein
MTWKTLLGVVVLAGCGGSAVTDFNTNDEAGTAGGGGTDNPGSMQGVDATAQADRGSIGVADAAIDTGTIGCRSSLDCPTDLVCDPAARRCVQCLTDRDCSMGQSCAEQRCVVAPAPGCKSNDDCKTDLSLRICNMTNGKCVACVALTDCPKLNDCVSNECRPTNACIATTDCKPEQYCSNNMCVADVCTAGSTTCLSNGVATCKPDGSGFGAPVACGAQQSCTSVGQGALCKDQICVPSVISCSAMGEQVVKCASDGLSSTVQGDCAANSQVCIAAKCEPVVCAAGQRYCQGQEVRQCSAKGEAYSVVKTCLATEYCDAVSKDCKPQLCTPNAPVCNLNVATTCNAVGSGYVAGGIDCSPQFCSGGNCISVLFQEDFEDGNYDGWTVGTGAYTRSVVNTTGAAGTTSSLYLTRTGSGTDDGIYYLFGSPLAPKAISFWAQVTSGYAYLDVFSTTTTTNQLFRFYSNGGIFYAYDGPTPFSTGITCTQWRHIELRNINWSLRTFDLYIDNALVRAGTKLGTTGSSISRLDLFVFQPGNIGYWDQFEFFP